MAKIDIPSYKSDFSKILRETDQFRNASAEELKVYKDLKPCLIISCPIDQLEKVNGKPMLLPENESPMDILSQYGWSFRYTATEKKDPVTAEISMCSEIFGKQVGSPSDEQTGILPTWQYQSTLTAIELVHFCIEYGWQSIHIEDGSDLCKFTLWATCQLLEMPCTGFDDTGYDRLRLKNASDDIKILISAFSETLENTAAPAPTSGKGSSSRSSDSNEDDAG